MQFLSTNNKLLPRCLALSFTLIQFGCGSSTNEASTATEIPTLPVVQVKTASVTTYQEFSATLEGRVNVDIRPQVEGYLEKIYVDEGATVRKGQPLFRIDTRTYREQVGNADASLLAAKANLDKAALEVARLTPLVENNVVSDVQLKAAQSAYAAAKANVAQAQSMVGNANVNLSRTLITAPASGFIGRLPYKVGSLVGRAELQPLTTVSDVHEIYAYFSMGEVDFLRFTQQASGGSLADKIRKLPPVELVLADGKAYAQHGRIEMVSGQFDKTMGAISFRAVFPNSQGLLRSGISGRVRIPEPHPSAVVIPQEATFERQDRVFVFAVADSNKVVSKPLQIAGKSGNFYLITKGVKPGERIVQQGLDRLRDGDAITPRLVAVDSLTTSREL
ncbi:MULTISPECIES: efflux RND transporter periplasmic adaptor subunit [Spirosoma]|uniref:Efflux RND transporter periplasmic adaptor subunit n=1 Tax=Spirosoma liriopis TaxID=2937440 RepID=A0ABT0HSE8_9BACT|nr:MULTISPECIES: efflux RND transporter periplasmic adaptor subunit [Spirosoma]MCK8495104.1 efflux RND transporter periplasmic adaptor subunit [Spirosoma liriopis]UHG94308.1 efflux RND transporter periplasmic adaptor subunit [Spirosoma oryzicola]